MDYNDAIRSGITEYLTSVDSNIQHLPEDERREIIQNIESHIYEALEKTSKDQPSADELHRILAQMDTPESYYQREGEGSPARTTTLKVEATATGRVVNWKKFKQGQLVDVKSRLWGLSTLLPNAITDALAICQSYDDEYKFKVLIPNGFTTASIDLVIIGKGFQVTCARRLVRGWFPLNPFAAEYGSNYDVVFTIQSRSRELESKLLNKLREDYLSTEVSSI